MNNIDVIKSIKSDRLVYTNPFIKISTLVYNLLIICPIIFMLSYDNFKELNIYKYSTFIIPILYLILSLVLIYWIFKNDKFYRVKNILNDVNKMAIENYLIKIVEKRNWVFVKNTSELKILDIPMWEVQFGYKSRLYLIYDKNDLLINFSSFGVGDLKISFNYFCNRSMEKKVASKIIVKTENGY